MRQLKLWEQNFLRKHGFQPEEVVKNLGEMPVEYFVGKSEWGDLELKVDENVLIPREETWELVQLVLKHVAWHRLPAWQIADVGTGSGAIASAVARGLQARGIQYSLTAIDVSESALAIAHQNFDSLELKNVQTQQSNLLADVHTTFDLIIANLPYIPAARIQNLDASVKDFEPHLALDGGADGLDLVRALLVQAERKLNSGGEIWLEVDDSHFPEMISSDFPQFTFQVFPDQFGVNRCWRLINSK